MRPSPFENVLLPRVGNLRLFREKSIDEINEMIRPHGYELISSGRPIPKSWPKSMYSIFKASFFINDRWQKRVVIHWFEKMRCRDWRRFGGFARRKPPKIDDLITAFIYERRRHRVEADTEFIPVVFIQHDSAGSIKQAWKTWCLGLRRCKSSDSDPRWQRAGRRNR